MSLEGGERLVLTALKDLGRGTGDYVEDARLAIVTKMLVEDVRDLLESLESEGFVERARQAEGFSAYITAKGKQALRKMEPIPTPTHKGGTDAEALPSSGPGDLASAPNLSSDSEAAGPICLFYSYSHDDESLRDELAKHLSALKRQGLIAGWHDRMIGAGEEWKGAIDRNLEQAQIILLLVSSSFLASDYCWDVETKRAVERHDQGGAMVIPIIVRPCDWHGSPFAKLQSLPKDGKAVTSWSNRDEAWTDIAKGIRRAVVAMRSKQSAGQDRPESERAGDGPEATVGEPNEPATSGSVTNPADGLRSPNSSWPLEECLTDERHQITLDRLVRQTTEAASTKHPSACTRNVASFQAAPTRSPNGWLDMTGRCSRSCRS